MKRRTGPVPDEYQGCRRACFDNLEHTLVPGECEQAPMPPCEHPADSIGWHSGVCAVVCRNCGQEVTLQGLAEVARPAISYGCRCEGDTCQEECWEGRAIGWTLDPRKILAYVAAEQEGMRTGRTLMLSLPSTQWEPLAKAARERRSSIEAFCRTAVLRRIRDFQRYGD